jgi:hypothetical protein
MFAQMAAFSENILYGQLYKLFEMLFTPANPPECGKQVQHDNLSCFA